MAISRNELWQISVRKSLGQAAKRFEEHYGWAINRATVRREVEKTAPKAQKFVEVKLFIARSKDLKTFTTKPNIEQLLVELDGCHISASAPAEMPKLLQENVGSQT